MPVNQCTDTPVEVHAGGQTLGMLRVDYNLCIINMLRERFDRLAGWCEAGLVAVVSQGGGFRPPW